MSFDITASDFFCGAGGSSSGLVGAGITVRHAANHWTRAIETHQRNHPHTDHSVDDLQQAHASWYPRTDIAWFSPECTNHSLAKGKKRKSIGQLDLWGESRVDPSEERSRATMREVVEFTEYHRYEIVIVENVVDIRYWQHFDAWLTAMHNLGYQSRILYLNAQFFGVPQSRDRFYAVFWKRGNRAPDLDFRPLATCKEHGQVHAVQAWKKTHNHWGRYGARRQYVYRCPHCAKEVQPPHVPARNVIDWSIPSPKISDRERLLKPRTIERIMAGLKKFGEQAQIVDTAYADGQRVHSAGDVLPTQTQRQTFALVEPFITAQRQGWDPSRSIDDPLHCITTYNKDHQLVIPPYLVLLHGATQPIAIDEPLKTIVATTSQHVLVTPPFLVHQRPTGTKDDVSNPVSLDDPLRSLVTVSQHALISPPPFLMTYYGKQGYEPVSNPMATITGVQRHALVTPEEMLPECGFRMLEPEELMLGMGFVPSYIVTGNKRERVKQVGNAVCPPVAEWIAVQCVESLT